MIAKNQSNQAKDQRRSNDQFDSSIRCGLKIKNQTRQCAEAYAKEKPDGVFDPIQRTFTNGAEGF